MNVFEAAEKGLADELTRMDPAVLGSTDEHGQTPMHFAMIGGHVAAIEILAKLAPRTLDATNSCGSTPMHWATTNGHVAAIEVLAKLAPRTLEAPNDYGSTPMHYAALEGRVSAIELVAKLAPRTLEAPNNYGITPMHFAAEYGRPAALETLLTLAHHTTFAKNDDGKTPFDLANRENIGHALARHVALTEAQWDSLRCPEEELEKILPAVLKRSREEAGWLLRKLPGKRREVRATLLAAHRLGLPTGLEEKWIA